jgi:hypothetical protein
MKLFRRLTQGSIAAATIGIVVTVVGAGVKF